MKYVFILCKDSTMLINHLAYFSMAGEDNPSPKPKPEIPPVEPTPVPPTTDPIPTPPPVRADSDRGMVEPAEVYLTSEIAGLN
jgi:hypothetical protein